MYKSTSGKNNPLFPEFSGITNKVVEAFDLIDSASLKLVVSDINNMGLISQSTGNNDNKVENMCGGCSDDDGEFIKLENIQRSDIEAITGARLLMSLNVFSFWIMSQ